MDRTALLIAAAAGAAAQLLLVVVGHFVPFVADNLFALGGVAISLAAGALYALRAPADSRWGRAGAAVGAACALIGIAVSTALGDVPPVILLVGGLSGAVGGLIGAALARMALRRSRPGP
jgi:hypothetical protein